MTDSKPRILVIDAYDSFTNNIISLLVTDINCSVRVIQIDTPLSDAELKFELQQYDAVVCGPGPGDPSKDEDAGLMKRIWKLADEDLLPVLGICLGFQSLALSCGASIRRLNQGLHGIIHHIEHIGQASTESAYMEDTIFNKIDDIEATLYHSLCINTGHESYTNKEFEEMMWQPSENCPDLQPLAWCVQEDAQDSRILMAIQHTTKPFWGLQYHPESICTNLEGRKLLSSWFDSARAWNHLHSRQIMSISDRTAGRAGPVSLLAQYSAVHKELRPNIKARKRTRLLWDSIDLPMDWKLPVLDLALHMNGRLSSQIILQSTNADLPKPPDGIVDVRGRYSIIALGVDDAMQIQYKCGSNCCEFKPSNRVEGDSVQAGHVSIPLRTDIWSLLAWVTKEEGLCHDASYPDIPFWGGFLGYTSYEMGLEGINVNIRRPQSETSSSRPDLHFAWITSSLVIDHQSNKVYVQRIQDISSVPSQCTSSTREPAAYKDLCEKISAFIEATSCHKSYIVSTSAKTTFPATVKLPDLDNYEAKVAVCQDYIRAGESYELCLTDQTHIKLMTEGKICSLDIYKRLCSTQPAPMASYIRLGQCTFISASPERFLTWDASGECSLRPMKGTVKKTASVTTLEQAAKLLNVPKERAENLMIVDLVRHDLHSICGPGGVTVPKLMEVEEYASVFQMVTEVRGQIPTPSECDPVNEYGFTGIDVLAASLPPGSMTGAPKKRSCELLRQIEGGLDRSLYSGVVGYMDAGGRGDFSVNIRCLFNWQGEHEWHVGAGGAVTGLSTTIGEREEMMTKLAGTLGLFEPVPSEGSLHI